METTLRRSRCAGHRKGGPACRCCRQWYRQNTVRALYLSAQPGRLRCGGDGGNVRSGERGIGGLGGHGGGRAGGSRRSPQGGMCRAAKRVAFLGLRRTPKSTPSRTETLLLASLQPCHAALQPTCSSPRVFPTSDRCPAGASTCRSSMTLRGCKATRCMICAGPTEPGTFETATKLIVSRSHNAASLAWDGDLKNSSGQSEPNQWVKTRRLRKLSPYVRRKTGGENGKGLATKPAVFRSQPVNRRPNSTPINTLRRAHPARSMAGRQTSQGLTSLPDSITLCRWRLRHIEFQRRDDGTIVLAEGILMPRRSSPHSIWDSFSRDKITQRCCINFYHSC
jgi:hypothetical protein